jgi:uncharacterized protein
MVRWGAPVFVLFAVGAAIAAIAGETVGLAVAIGLVGIVVVGFTTVWAVAVWKSWRWQVWPDALELAHGVIVRRESLVPFHRIQQIDVRKTPLERLLGLASLEVHTAAATSDAVIPALDQTQAEPLR